MSTPNHPGRGPRRPSSRRPAPGEPRGHHRPGFIAVRVFSEEEQKGTGAMWCHAALKRFGRAEEVAELRAFLADDKAPTSPVSTSRATAALLVPCHSETSYPLPASRPELLV
jgi:NAD(P)-dependent dehydrogenase (short-subunit alcohol dehydrogenase family)